jgi:hypothetical protein
VPILAGATLLFIAGSVKNLSFDNPPDVALERASRFAPRLTYDARWRWSWAFLAGGIALMGLGGIGAAFLGLVLAGSILMFHWNSKKFWQAPAYLGLCRTLAYVAGALAAPNFSGAALWSGVTLGIYFAGVHYLARTHSLTGASRYWPFLLLLAPVFLAQLMNKGEYQNAALLLSAVLVLWTLRCLRPLFWQSELRTRPDFGGLVCGLVFVDWLAVADSPRMLSIAFLGLFFSALLFQKQRVSAVLEDEAVISRRPPQLCHSRR